MTADNTYRDIAPSERPTLRDARVGRAWIAVIGIDRYRTWNRLYNAASDASGALKLFTGLGFDLVCRPLLDELATGDAIRRLATDDLAGLGKEDSLVLFFAGHGHTTTRTYYGGTSVKDGYIIPVDGDRPGGRAGTWIRLESWLTEITRIPAKHILVILDACHSGLALGPIIQWRSRGMEIARREPLEQLRARRSRRIITSALDDQLAMDSGPVLGHSLFTGCLIEAMTGGLVASSGQRMVTGSQIGHYVQRRVSEYPGSIQTPDFGALELDDRGELVVCVALGVAGVDMAQATEAAATGPPSYPLRSGTPAPLTGTTESMSTALGASTSQVAAPMLRTRARKVGKWLIASVALLGVAGTTIAVVTTCGDGTTHTMAPTDDVGTVTLTSTGDATMTPIDAELELSDPSPSDGPADALPADAPANAAPAKRPFHPHSTTPHTTDPPWCDRTIDTDCDGIPDTR